jgi:hypothetical protein
VSWDFKSLWMASNVSVTMDPAGNLEAGKAKSTERI